MVPGGIDTHQHYWRYSATGYAWIDERMARLKRDFVPEDVWPAMQRSGFSQAIAVQARQTADETRALLAFAERAPWVAGVVGWADLSASDVEETLHAMRHPKLVGMRHIVQDEPDERFLLREDFSRGVALLESFGLTYDILVFPRHLPVVAEFVARFPSQRFVLDHLAKPDIRNGASGGVPNDGRDGERAGSREAARTGSFDTWACDMEKVAAFPNVMVKVSGLVTEASWTHWSPDEISPYLDVVVDLFGMERLMVGSDWPVCTLAATYERTMSVATNYFAARSERERAAVFGDNARRFWRLPGEVVDASAGADAAIHEERDR